MFLYKYNLHIALVEFHQESYKVFHETLYKI